MNDWTRFRTNEHGRTIISSPNTLTVKTVYWLTYSHVTLAKQSGVSSVCALTDGDMFDDYMTGEKDLPKI